MGVTKRRPNIVIIMADDMGFSDIGCYGSEIASPNLDALAANGVRFTQMYNCARCCPTRASLLTGLYPHQAGIGLMCGDHGSPAYQGYLRDDCVTIAEALKSGGYRTLMCGKWHVGGDYDAQRPETWRPGEKGHPRPLDRGFDEFYGTLEGWANYFHPHTLMRNNEPIEPEPDDYYYTRAIGDEAAAMIERNAKRAEPFFLYVAHVAPHWPLHALPEDIEKYRGRYRRGWDATRTDRHERQIESGLLDPNWPISPRDEQAPDWTDIPRQEWEDLRMAVYAAQVEAMDRSVGSVMDALRDQAIEDNTLVLFLSDNGGCAEFLSENGHFEQFIPRSPRCAGIVLGNSPDRDPGPEETYMSYDLPWTNVSNAPFRLYKHWVHEGGISTPLIAHWPAAISSPNRIVHDTAHVIDLMATCLDVADVKHPEEHNGHRITPLEGESLAPVFRGESWSRQNPVFWEHEGNCAVRAGEWKLVRRFSEDWELYNMLEDRTELIDLAGGDRARVEEMAKMHQAWGDRCGVVPYERFPFSKNRKPEGSVWKCFRP